MPVKPDFSGDWELVRGESEFGFLPPPRLRTDSIDHREPEIHILTRQVDSNGDIAVERRLTIGGEPSEVTIRGRVRRIGARWDGDQLVIETQSEVSGNPRRMEDRWRLSTDREVAIIERFQDLPGGGVRQRITLRRRGCGPYASSQTARQPRM